MDVRIRIPNRMLIVAAAASAGVVVGYVARAAVPADANALVYSGVLEDNGALVDGTRAISVSIFDDASAGTLLCGPVNQPTTPVVNGRFSMALPASCATAVHQNAAAFVEVDVGGVPVGARSSVGAVPFALEAGHATSSDTVATVTSWTPYAPAPVFGTLAGGPAAPATSFSSQGTFRRVGDSIDVQLTIVVTGDVTNASGRWLFGMPAGLLVDESKLAAGGTFFNIVGVADIAGANGNHACVVAAIPNDTAGAFQGQGDAFVEVACDGGTDAALQGDPVTCSAAASCVLELRFTVPVR